MIRKWHAWAPDKALGDWLSLWTAAIGATQHSLSSVHDQVILVLNGALCRVGTSQYIRRQCKTLPMLAIAALLTLPGCSTAYRAVSAHG